MTDLTRRASQSLARNPVSRPRAVSFLLVGLVLFGGGLLLGEARAQAVFELKLSHFMPPTHAQHGRFQEWAAELALKSNGRLDVEIFPSEQMGPLGEQYDLARRGDADFSYFPHSIPADRFPLMELTHLPFLFESAQQASRVLMTLLPEYLAAEHRGVKVLYLHAHAPGNIHTRSVPVRTPRDLQGLRIRHPSSVASEILRGWAASPVGMAPALIAENLERGVIEGLLIPYDGIIGFRLAPFLRYSTEIRAYINTFALVMNPETYENLPADLRQIIDETAAERALSVARGWDDVEPRGRQYAQEEGLEIIPLTEEERAAFRDAAQGVIESRLEETANKGLPARAFLRRVRELARMYAGSF